MIDFKNLAARLPYYLQNCKHRHIKASPTQVLDLLNRFNKQADLVEGYRAYRDQQVEAKDTQQTEVNDKAKKHSEANLLLEQLELKKIETQLIKAARKLPNAIHHEVPISKAKVIKQSSETLPPLSKDFLSIAKDLKLCRNTPCGNQLTDVGATLEQGLVSYALDFLKANDFGVIALPSLIPLDIVDLFDEAKHIPISGHKLVLSKSAEVSLLSCIPKGNSDLMQLSGASVSFVESGTALVQTTQVAAVVLCEPGQSDQQHSRLANLQEEFLASLNIPYRVMMPPAKDLSQSAYLTYKYQAWLPSQQAWFDLSSTTNCTDFLARRLNWSKDKVFLHNVQASLFHSKSLIAVLVELSERNGRLELPIDVAKYTGLS